MLLTDWRFVEDRKLVASRRKQKWEMKMDQQEADCLGERGPSDIALAPSFVHCYRQIFPSSYTLPLPTCLLWDYPLPSLTASPAPAEQPGFCKDVTSQPAALTH